MTPLRRTKIVAVACSLALHALAFLWLRTLPAVAPLHRLPETPGIELEITARKAPAVSQAGGQSMRPAGAHKGERPGRSRPSMPIATSASAAPGTSTGEPSDVPRAVDLSPRIAPGADGTGSAGDTTERNVPGGYAEVLPPRTQAHIQAWIDEDTAITRVEKGLVDDWFGHFGRALGDALDKKPPPLSVLPKGLPLPLASMARRYGAALDRLSKTGSPGPGWGPAPGDPAEGLASRLQDLRSSQALDGRRLEPLLSTAGERDDLWALVEVRMGFGGALRGSRVIDSSGSRTFNHYVIELVVEGLPGLPDLPDGGFGIHADGARSVWEVAGHLTFARDMRKLSLKDDYWYLPLAAASGLLKGEFDETTGYVGYADFRYPRIQCTVKLVGVD